MYKSLMPDFLSIKASLPRAIALAARYGFAGVDTTSAHLTASDLDFVYVQDQMQENAVLPGYISLPLGRLPVPEAEWNAAMVTLPEVARCAQRLGFQRAGLVILPFHEMLPFGEAFESMVRHLNTVMTILDDYGIALGLEYVSPLTRRAPYPHTFVHDLRGMLTLCDAVDSPHAGLMLDTFHWHCAGETVADLERLKGKVAVVHINDAPPVPAEEQVVSDRALPGATGVIDIVGFLGALRTIGYDGPVTSEPMAKAITEISPQTEENILLQTSAPWIDSYRCDSTENRALWFSRGILERRISNVGTIMSRHVGLTGNDLPFGSSIRSIARRSWRSTCGLTVSNGGSVISPVGKLSYATRETSAGIWTPA